MSDSYIIRPQSPQAEAVMRTGVVAAFKAVMELGFLYVSRRVDIEPILKLADSKFTPEILEKEFSVRPWIPDSQNKGYTEMERRIFETASQGVQPIPTPWKDLNITFTLPTVKTWCATCDEITLHDSIPYIHSSLYHLNPEAIKEQPGHKTFLLNYQCQQCKRAPITFLIRRELLKVQLSGRSSMHVHPPPPEIPRLLRKIYTDAIGAAACNDIPAAFYHWRTLIEHLMKGALGKRLDEKVEGEQLAADYNKTVNPIVAEQASLTETMRLCSQHLHARTGEEAELEKVRKRIEQHLKLIETLKDLNT